jgi:hypothetical protein
LERLFLSPRARLFYLQVEHVQVEPQLQSTHLQFGLLHFTFSVTVETAWFVVVADFITFFLVVIDRTKVHRESGAVITILCV